MPPQIGDIEPQHLSLLWTMFCATFSSKIMVHVSLDHCYRETNQLKHKNREPRSRPVTSHESETML